jgi:hypothetical protein
MTNEQVRALWKAQPFRPFALHVADGRSFHVPHSEFLSLDPRGRIAIVWDQSGTFNVVDVMLVKDIEVPVESQKDNGEASGEN